jgi:hypothetical protein
MRKKFKLGERGETMSFHGAPPPGQTHQNDTTQRTRSGEHSRTPSQYAQAQAAESQALSDEQGKHKRQRKAKKYDPDQWDDEVVPAYRTVPRSRKPKRPSSGAASSRFVSPVVAAPVARVMSSVPSSVAFANVSSVTSSSFVHVPTAPSFPVVVVAAPSTRFFPPPPHSIPPPQQHSVPVYQAPPPQPTPPPTVAPVAPRMTTTSAMFPMSADEAERVKRTVELAEQQKLNLTLADELRALHASVRTLQLRGDEPRRGRGRPRLTPVPSFAQLPTVAASQLPLASDDAGTLVDDDTAGGGADDDSDEGEFIADDDVYDEGEDAVASFGYDEELVCPPLPLVQQVGVAALHATICETSSLDIHSAHALARALVTCADHRVAVSDGESNTPPMSTATSSPPTLPNAAPLTTSSERPASLIDSVACVALRIKATPFIRRHKEFVARPAQNDSRTPLDRVQSIALATRSAASNDSSHLLCAKQMRRGGSRGPYVLDPFNIGRNGGFLEDRATNALTITSAAVPLPSAALQIDVPSVNEIYTPQWRKSCADVPPPEAELLTQSAPARIANDHDDNNDDDNNNHNDNDDDDNNNNNDKNSDDDAAGTTAGAVTTASAGTDGGLFSPPPPVARKKRSAPKTLRFGQGVGDSAAVVAHMQATRRHTLLSSTAMLVSAEDEAESSEDDDDERIASLHLHREIDERSVLLTPVLECVDGVWRPKKNHEKVGRMTMAKEGNAEILQFITEHDTLKRKPVERPSLSHEVLKSFKYLDGADSPGSSVSSTFVPNEQDPPMRAYAPDAVTCLSCAYCDGVGAVADELRGSMIAAMQRLPATTFCWQTAPKKRRLTVKSGQQEVTAAGSKQRIRWHS